MDHISLAGAYLIIKNRHNNFGYKPNFLWWSIIIASSLTLLIAFVTVSYQTLNAAFMNPAKSIRYE